GEALFESIVVFENYPVDASLAERAAEGQVLSVGQVKTFERTNYPLSVVVAPGEEMSVNISYDERRFEAREVERIGEQLERVLAGMAEDPRRKLSELSLLSEQERERVLREWNDTDAELPTGLCVHELFERQVELRPEALALVGEGESLTYRELNERANRLARHLRSLGVGAEALVGLCLPRSAGLVVGLLGVLKAGGAYVPLDAEYPAERLRFMAEDAGLKALVTDSELSARLPLELCGEVVCVDTEWGLIAAQPAENVARQVSGLAADNLAYVIYTSGSAGRPKGVMVPHGALSGRIKTLTETLELEEGDRLLQFVSPSFDAFAEEFYTTLSSGAALVVHRNPAEMTAHEFLSACREQGVSVLHFPAAYWHQLTNELAALGQSLPARVRMCLTGGESPSAERLAKWFELSAPGSKHINAYGPTEAVITSTVYKTSAAAAETGEAARLPMGRPIQGTRVYILDSELQPVPVGVTGELYIGGGSLARGYLHNPALAAERFVPDLYGGEAGARLYKTGDFGCYLPDGNIKFLGRADAQVKIRGYRVELAEVEGVLGRHPDVLEAVVVARQNEGRGKYLAAYVVADLLHLPTQGELRAYVRERLPEYMTPSAFVLLEALPLTPNGKIDHDALPAPDFGASELEGTYVAPRTANEITLARIWEELLNVRRVGIHDNFFELGGDSIISIQVIARANRAGLSLTPRQLFQHQTVAELAAAS
ncbi:MAG TPA: amino acid adenylation domain-containing protein, partial [Pyrinomonadaceae bacterium]